MTTKYYVDGTGKYLGGFAGATGAVPSGAIEVPTAPSSAADIWNGSAWTPTPLPAIAQIRAIEAAPAVADAMQRAARLVALSYAIDDLIRVAASKGQTVTRTQAHDWAMVYDSNYKTLYDTEQAIKPLRALV